MDIRQQIEITIVNKVKKILKNLADKRDHFASEEGKYRKKMWYCEACEKDKNSYSKSFHFESTAQMKKKFNFRKKCDHTDEKYLIDDPISNKLSNMVEKTFEDFLQEFHNFNYKCENKAKFVQREDGEEVAHFTLENSFRNKSEPIDEKKTKWMVNSHIMNKEKEVLVLIV